MNNDFQENDPILHMLKDDHTIFEAIMKDEPNKIYEILDGIQAPYRKSLIEMLENIDEKYHEHISDEEIEEINVLLFDEQNQDKFLTVDAFHQIASFLKKEKYGLSPADIQAFEILDNKHRSDISNFLNTVTTHNDETPLIHACVWGKLKAAEIIKNEGADMPANLLRKAIQWSSLETVNWVLDNNGGIVTLGDIETAKNGLKKDVFRKVEGVYKRTHPEYKTSDETSVLEEKKERCPQGTSRIGRRASIPGKPRSRDGR